LGLIQRVYVILRMNEGMNHVTDPHCIDPGPLCSCFLICSATPSTRPHFEPLGHRQRSPGPRREVWDVEIRTGYAVDARGYTSFISRHHPAPKRISPGCSEAVRPSLYDTRPVVFGPLLIAHLSNWRIRRDPSHDRGLIKEDSGLQAHSLCTRIY
jgi:hypothetical protein